MLSSVSGKCGNASATVSWLSSLGLIQTRRQCTTSLKNGRNRLPFQALCHTNIRGQKYSTTRIIRDKTSFMDHLGSQTKKLWQSGKHMADDAMDSSASVAKEASSKTLRSTHKFAEEAAITASKKASETLTMGQKNLDQAFQQSSRHLRESASRLSGQAQAITKEKTSNLSRTASEKLSRATDTLNRKSRDSINATKQATSKAVEQNIQQPIQNTSKRIGETSQKVVDTVTASGTKFIKWGAMWSLAAIFVYGVATATPMAILKFVTREKQKDIQEQ